MTPLFAAADFHSAAEINLVLAVLLTVCVALLAVPFYFLRKGRRDLAGSWFAAVLILAIAPGCVSSGPATAPTDKQTTIANAVEDTLAIGLVPVLVKNPDYVSTAAAVSVALTAFQGESLSALDVQAFLAKTNLTADDAATVAALVNAAWDTYSRRYAQQVGASVRPDIKLFMGAVSNGISRAVAALPKPVAFAS